jgi:hypothetical protein
VLAWLNRLNAKHPWSHNDFYGPWVVRQVRSTDARKILDVGSGTGKHPRRARSHPEGMTAPSVPARESLAAIAAETASFLPGARIRRRTFWRYPLVYDAPR